MHTTLWGHYSGEGVGVTVTSLSWDGDTTAFLHKGTFPFVRACLRLCVTLVCVCVFVHLSEYDEYVCNSFTRNLTQTPAACGGHEPCLSTMTVSVIFSIPSPPSHFSLTDRCSGSCCAYVHNFVTVVHPHNQQSCTQSVKELQEVAQKESSVGERTC